MASANEDISLFQEIDESLRVDKMEKLMRRYGKLLIAFCVAIVLATAASVFWKSHLREINIKRTDRLLEVTDLIESGKFADAQKMLEDINQSNATTISRLMLAETLIDQGQADKAVKAFDDAGVEKSNQALHDLSSLDAQIISDNHNLPAQKDGTESLRKLYDSNSPFSYTAGELYALQLQRAGKSKDAEGILSEISNNPRLGMAQRIQAKELLDSMKGSKQ
jgi:hypothetical protein